MQFMKTTFDRSSMTGGSIPDGSTPGGAEFPAALSQWYKAHPAVRRLRAVEDSNAVIIHVTLEPTPDGHDTLPVWLAHSRNWIRDLQSLTNRDVELRLVDIEEVTVSYETTDAVLLTELRWRDPLDDSLA